MRRVLVLMAVLAMVFVATCCASWAAADWRLTLTQGVWQSGTVYWMGSNQDVYAGALKMKVDKYDAGHQNIIQTYYSWMYCIDKAWYDPNDWYERQQGGIPINNIPDLNEDKWARKVWLINRYGWNSWLDVDKATGLQLAIWEVITDDTLDLNAGNFQIVSGYSTAAISYANTLLGLVQKASQAEIAADIYYVNDQNMNEVPPIPEPFTLVLATLGIGTVAGLRRLVAR
ncbi:MAG: hypothetical protein QHI38_03610 [Armatimonadota bacterium]|nr:hypothetical protein [Armatimonadota bacterium]